MIEQLLELDTNLFIYLNGLGNKTWDGFWMFYTTKFYWIPFYVVLLYLIYKNYTVKQFLIFLLVTVALIAFTDQVTNLFKDGFERPRPCHNDSLDTVMRLVKSYCGYPYGFFSGHSSNSMAVAFFIGFLLKKRYAKALPLLIFWSLLMGYSRIYIGVHYPLDVLCGFAFGGLAGWLFYKLTMVLHAKYAGVNTIA